jgi:FlaG/FlaF family flagellin (archaellin)
VLACLLALAAVIGVFVTGSASSRPAKPGSEFRVRNGSSLPFHQVVVNGQLYGDIDAGQVSGYRHMQVAYRYASVELTAGTQKMRFIPEDYMSETPLDIGNFTYVLKVVDAEQIDIAVEKIGNKYDGTLSLVAVPSTKPGHTLWQS